MRAAGGDVDADDVWRAVSWRSVAVMIAFATGAAMIGFAGTLLVSPSYTASARVYIGIPVPPSTDGGGSLAAFPRERLIGYGALAQSRPVLQRAIDEAGLTDDVPALADDIRVSSPKATSLLDISIDQPSGEYASRAANAVATALAEAITEIESPSPFRVQVVAPATRPSSPSAPYVLRIMALFAVVGAALGVAWTLRGLLRHEVSPAGTPLRARFRRQASMSGRSA